MDRDRHLRGPIVSRGGGKGVTCPNGASCFSGFPRGEASEGAGTPGIGGDHIRVIREGLGDRHRTFGNNGRGLGD